MDVETWLSVVSGIVGILGFMFAIWVWIRADSKSREMNNAMQALHDIAASALWESQMVVGEDSAARIAQLEKSIGLVSAMRTLTARYVDDRESYRATELGALVQRGVIWSNEMILKLEKSPEVHHIWLVTHDLEPDISEERTGALVKRNVDSGVSYTYFYPAELKSANDQLGRLRRNVGADDPRRAKKVSFIPLRANDTGRAFLGVGNIILFFKDDPKYGTDLVLQEVVLTKISRRGLFWQEYAREHRTELLSILQRHVDAAAPHQGKTT